MESESMSSELSFVELGQGGVYLSSSKVLVEDRSASTSAKRPPVRPPDPENTSSNPWMEWGDSNLYPQDIIKLVKSTSVLAPTLEYKMLSLVAEGIKPMREVLENDKLVLKDLNKETAEEKVVIDWCKAARLNDYQRSCGLDLPTFGMGFAELRVSIDRTRIAGIKTVRAPWVRLGKQDKNGAIKTAYIHADWERCNGDGDDHLLTREVLDLDGDPIAQIREGSAYSYIYPIRWESIGAELYYSTPPWHSAIESKWISLAQRIPKFKEAVLKNQMHVRYHIMLHPKHWELREPNYNELKPEEQRAIREKFYTEVDQHVHGEGNAGKDIFSSLGVDDHGKEYQTFKIEPIPNLDKQKLLLEDGDQAVSHLLLFFNVDQTLFGHAPTQGMGAGSGSDKRIAWNLEQIKQTTYRKKLIEPLELIAQYNGWPEDVVFHFPTRPIEPQNEVSPAKRGEVPAAQ